MKNTLKEFLKNLVPGPVSDTSAVEELLAEAWLDLDGDDIGGMKTHKLYGRTEFLSWQPPFLTFTIERHGGTVLGSTRAELQHWQIDISKGTRKLVSTSRRQLRAASPPLDVGPLAQKIGNEIMNKSESPFLKRYPDGRVKVLIGKVIPEGVKETTFRRRKRFRKALQDILSRHGWLPASVNTYRLNRGAEETQSPLA
jgi:hypothetical protein